MKKEEILKKLIDISIQMSSHQSLNELLETIVEKAREITNADAGSLYLKENNRLRFVITQNDSLKGKAANFKSFLMDIDKNSIAGFTAHTGEIVNIDDLYNIPSVYPFTYNRSFDEKYNYKC